MHYLSVFYYAFEAMVTSEINGMVFDFRVRAAGKSLVLQLSPSRRRRHCRVAPTAPCVHRCALASAVAAAHAAAQLLLLLLPPMLRMLVSLPRQSSPPCTARRNQPCRPALQATGSAKIPNVMGEVFLQTLGEWVTAV